MNISTRKLFAETPDNIVQTVKPAAFLRADIWRRFGALKNQGKNCNTIRKEITALGIYKDLDIDGVIRGETTKDIVNDILLYKAAAKEKVRKAIYARTTDNTERKRLYTLLKSDKWLEDNFLHRKMRKHFRHGVAKADNQFVVRSDKFATDVVDGYLVITIRIAKKYGSDIILKTNSSGKNVILDKRNLRVIVKGGVTEVHYNIDKGIGRICGDKPMGIDKGYTEAFTDSDGIHHGQGFGKVLTRYSDTVSSTGKGRNKFYALEKKHRDAGRIAKANMIKENNRGRIKLDARNAKAEQQLRTICFKAAHQIVDKANLIASEDLTSPIANKKPWKKFNRRMSAWAKGVLAESIDSVCKQRGADHILINAAYTSQTDSITGRLEGRRVGDKFHRENGDVLQADHNAALNVLGRVYDSEITLYTPYRDVKNILLERLSGGTDRHEA